MMILVKPFLVTIHAQIDVFNGEISFGIGEDRVKFDVNGNSHHSNTTLEKVYMATEKEFFNPLKIEDDLFSYESPACLQFDQNTRIHTNSDIETIDSPSNIQKTGESGHKAVYGKGELLQSKPIKPRPCDYSFEEWLKVKIGHTSIENSDREKVLNEWVLDSFDIEADYAKMFANPYSRRFDEYKRIFINEVEQLSNEYELRIRKKGYVLDDVWEKCKHNHGGTTYAWHDEGHEEEEL
ncbi:hypothetical protein Tco_1575370 [Tanacetum coccineum]